MLDDEARRMSRLVDELLGLARLKGERQRPFQRSMPARSSRKRRPAREPWAIARSSLRAHPGLVLGDPDLLDQALLNIVRNSVAHTNEGAG